MLKKYTYKNSRVPRGLGDTTGLCDANCLLFIVQLLSLILHNNFCSKYLNKILFIQILHYLPHTWINYFSNNANGLYSMKSASAALLFSRCLKVGTDHRSTLRTLSQSCTSPLEGMRITFVSERQKAFWNFRDAQKGISNVSILRRMWVKNTL